ncbi:DEAD/DEAH box helicase [Thermodesulfobacteriota bacterium]
MTNNRRHYHRPFSRTYKSGRGRSRKGVYENPRLDPALKYHFNKIGIPEPTTFKPDPFQLEALEKIKECDVLVSAPTGAGKTWVASQAIGQYIAKGLRTWYASPLKALSNSLYQEFSREFGPDSCGIITGERKENTGAPIIVGTTEILRNQLYDAMHEGANIEADLVILDEAHYLSDPDRGVVWEEVLIYLPSRVRLLLLSATISNPGEVCSWLIRNRGEQAHVVRSHERPVPLEMLFLFPDGLVAPLGGRKGLTSRVKKFVASRTVHGRIRGQRQLRFGDIIDCLRKFDLLPAIFFLKSRKDCDQALGLCHSAKKQNDIKRRLKREVKAFLREYPHLEGHRQIESLLESMVASHHAGQLPYWKILIEKMMNKGYLDVIFSTSTVAAGVNFPARTVALVQSDRYNGHEFTDLNATDLHQMIGRAGRRGKDNIGFTLIIPGLHQDPKLIYDLMDSPSDPLISQIRINFSMTLNLLLSHTPLEVKELLNLSFAAFQQKRSGSAIHEKWDETVKILKRMIPKGRCDTGDPYEIMENIRKRSELKKEARGLTRRIKDRNLLNMFRPYLKPGRLFHHKDKGVYVLFHTYTDRDRLICAAQNIERKVRSRKGKIRLKKVPFNKIRWIYDYCINLPEEYSLESLQVIFDVIDIKDLDILNTGDVYESGKTEGLDIIQDRIKDLPCEECEHLLDCHNSKNRELNRALMDFKSLANKVEVISEGLWISFKRHLRFLKETDFVDKTDRLTPDGGWASKLRLDHPLLIAEAIRNDGFSSLSPEVMAGCIALFVWDRDQEVELRIGDKEDLGVMKEAFTRIIESTEDIRNLKVKRGFENPLILFWPAAALFLWAKGIPWEKLLFYIPVNEGDMASMIVRTADHLRQVINLNETHPELAHVAAGAIDLILREPVFIP